jgi:hypothetical protein
MASKDEDLKSFKISDQVPKNVDGPKAKPGKGDEPEVHPSAGFPRIEALIEQNAPDFAGMEERYKSLQELEKSGKTSKEKGAAKKAALAYSHALGIIGYLLETKNKLDNPSEGE